jgi:hypothetical protein
MTCWGTWSAPLRETYHYILTRIIPDANMPLFTFIAGYLLSFQLSSGKYREFKSFLNNKVHRLLIPFLILGLLINLLEYGKSITDMLYGGPNHLWYCLMLFYCYILCWLVENKIGKWLNYLFMATSLIIAIYYDSIWNLWHTNIPGGWEFCAYYYGYFYLGFTMFRYKETFFSKKYWILLYLALYALFCIVKLPCGSIIPFRSISYIFLIYSLTGLLINKVGHRLIQNSFISILNKCSFGIYVFHQWIIWNLTRIPVCQETLRPIMEEHYIVGPICFATIIFLISLMLTHYSLKTKIGQYLL